MVFISSKGFFGPSIFINNFEILGVRERKGIMVNNNSIQISSKAYLRVFTLILVIFHVCNLPRHSLEELPLLRLSHLIRGNQIDVNFDVI